MTRRAGASGTLWAISDLHIGYEENRALVERTHPESDDDWLPGGR
ncbi:Metallophosphoesterase OS=Streptomyces tendae OX=1932 GN=GUR47_02195 PE=4 SV=1 [Streptomyces tendae]